MFSAYGHFPCIKQTIPKTARSKGLFEAKIKTSRLIETLRFLSFISASNKPLDRALDRNRTCGNPASEAGALSAELQAHIPVRHPADRVIKNHKIFFT